MKTDDNRDKLRLIKEFFILNMLQQPSCFININKTAKKGTTNAKQVLNENDSESKIPICDKLTMAKFLVALRLLQRPHSNKNVNNPSENSSINIDHKNKSTTNNLSLIKNSEDKSNAKFKFFIRQVTFKNNSDSIVKRSEMNTASDDIYEFFENKNADYLESSIPTSPIIIEAEDITDIPIE